jgi:parallel beta-helix repeat protein
MIFTVVRAALVIGTGLALPATDSRDAMHIIPQNATELVSAGTGTYEENCANKADDVEWCANWMSKGFCDSSKYHSKYRSKCRFTCSGCSTLSAEAEAAAIEKGEDYDEPDEIDDPCEGAVDTVKHCKFWKPKGYCDKVQYSSKCMATCNDCPVAPPPPPPAPTKADTSCTTLVDTSKYCKAWSDQGLCSKEHYKKKCEATCAGCEPPKDEPVTITELYVDAKNGNDNNDGTKLDKAFATIQTAVKKAGEGVTIYVAEGTYHNKKFGLGKTHNKAAVMINKMNDLKVINLQGHYPVIEFDGGAGIQIMDSTNIEIVGFEIKGQNKVITEAEATQDRLKHSPKYSGRGIFLISSFHVRVAHNEVHDCPNSGIRSNKGDYITIEHNHVYDCTMWSSNAESSIVVSDSRSYDDKEIFKMILRGNTVHGGVNQIPYYNSNYDDPQYLIKNQMHVAREGYGGKGQDFIIDGSGVYMTRNSATYPSGLYLIEGNVCYGNGINGIVIHKTDRAVVRDNVVRNNGQVPTTPPQSRQRFNGLCINHGHDVTVYNNTVTSDAKDFGFVIDDSSYVLEAGAKGPHWEFIEDDLTDFDPKESSIEAKYPNYLCGEAKIKGKFQELVQNGGPLCA